MAFLQRKFLFIEVFDHFIYQLISYVVTEEEDVITIKIVCEFDDDNYECICLYMIFYLDLYMFNFSKLYLTTLVNLKKEVFSEILLYHLLFCISILFISYVSPASNRCMVLL